VQPYAKIMPWIKKYLNIVYVSSPAIVFDALSLLPLTIPIHAILELTSKRKKKNI